MTSQDLLILAGAVILAVALVVVVQARRRQHGQFVHDAAGNEVCEHLRPALALLLERGYRVRRIGQKHRDLPFEVHLEPAFDPQQIYDELNLAEPVYVSERNVLYCRDDWCELHPPKV